MRKVAFAIAAAALTLLAGAVTAEAMTGSGTLDLRSTAKTFSPIGTVASGCQAPFAGWGGPGFVDRSGVLVRPMLALGRKDVTRGPFDRPFASRPPLRRPVF